MREYLKCLKCIFLMVCLYTVLLMLIFLIPDQGIQVHRDEAIGYINKVGYYPNIFFDSSSAKMDNLTDEVMLQITQPGAENPLISAMVPGYARYWHGYLVFLRPLLLIFDYFQIRFLGYFLSTMLLAILFGLLLKHSGWGVSIAFVASTVMVRFTVVPESLQFSSCFNIMMISSVWLLNKLDKVSAEELHLAVPFAIVGSVVNFVDFLTAPLITLGIPLIIYISEKIKANAGLWKTHVLDVFQLSFCWGLGYGITWILKWFCATLFLKENIFADAYKAILFRVEDNREYQVNRILTIGKNIFYIMGSDGIKVLFPVLALLIIVLFIMIWKTGKKALALLPLMLIACIPYVWYFILANHSWIHGYFTYRVQIVTVFAGGVMLCFLWGWRRERR